MIRRQLGGALLTLWAAASAANPAADNHVALIKTVTGQVSIVRGDTTLHAVPGTTVFVADRIRSGAGSSAGIVFKDGTLVTLGAASDFALRDYVFKPAAAKYAFSAYLAKGNAIYASGKIGKLAPEQIKVETPTATIGVRGTRFLIEAE